jgi:hypothetical protein
MAGRIREGVINQADAMLALLTRTRPTALAALGRDAVSELSGWTDVAVSLTEEDPVSLTDGVSRCSVAGHYGWDTQPPTLHVGCSRSLRRRQFTALHELGHHLQQTDPDLGEVVLGQPDSESFEDASCDVFASRVLLPANLVTRHISRRGPTANNVADLFAASSASRAACCVRAAEHLAGPGCVVLLDMCGVVSFAAAAGVYPPARGSDQSSTPLITAALSSGGRTVERDQTYIVYRNHTASDALYGQAAWCDGYIVAVLALDTVPWRQFAPPRPGTSRTVGLRWYDCPVCFTTFETGQVCKTCHEPRCPDGHCGCTLASEHPCTKCFELRHRSQFAAGSTICKACLE